MKPLTAPPTHQQAFDAVIQHFVVERNPRAVDPLDPSRCRYRTASGLTCAVGLLIPDHLYDAAWEQESLKTLIFELEEVQTRKLWFRGDWLLFLRELRTWHDRTLAQEEIPRAIERLNEIGRKFRLDLAKLTPYLET